MRATDLITSPLADSGRQPLLPVLGRELEVPLLDGRSVRYANLDYAATAPALASVADRVARVLAMTGSVQRGSGLPAQAAGALYESARRRVADALGARPDDLVVFTRNTTDATNLLAGCVPAGAGDVVALDDAHHANLLPWQRSSGLRCVVHAATIEETFERVEAALRARPTALLAVTGASNVTGEVLPIERAARLAHACGARLFVDAAQLTPHRAVSLAGAGIDYLALSGHKLYAPYGAGVLVGRSDWLDRAEPYLAGGGAVRNVAIEHTVWAAGASRHEAGTPNLAGAVALAAAFDALAGRDDERVAHEHALRAGLLSGIEALPGVRPLRIWSDSAEMIGVVAFTVDGYAPGHAGAYLSAEHGIGVRNGRFCAHPLLARFGLSGALRASFGVGSRSEDVDRLVHALAQLTSTGPRHDYREGATGWGPAHETRDLTSWLET